MSLRRLLPLAFLALVLAPLPLAPQNATAHAPANASHGSYAPTAPSESIPNLDDEKAQLRQYHDCTCKCGCYAKDLDLQADRAIAFLRQRAAHRAPNQKLALVLDIDETALSNYEEMLSAGFAYNSDAFNVWVNSAKAPAIPGTLRLAKEAKKLGVSVFFLTGWLSRSGL